MEKHFHKITENLYIFMIWDESWNSYNNCYILIKENDVIQIDSGKEEHFEHLESALKSINIDTQDISQFIATHGHKDHIGGVQYLEKAKGYIHSNDLELLPDNIRATLNPNLSDNGVTVGNLECVLLGHHTKGSVALYHKESKALFCGDHICFFGEPLIDNEVVGESNQTRDKFKDFVYDWSQNEDMKKQHDYDLFIKGLRAINKFDIEYLCTGHGVVLEGNINGFISDLLEE